MLPEKIDPDIANDAMPDNTSEGLASVTSEPDMTTADTAPIDLLLKPADEPVAETLSAESTDESAAAEAAASDPVDELAVPTLPVYQPDGARTKKAPAAAPAASPAASDAASVAAMNNAHHWEGPTIPFIPHHAIVEGIMALAFLTVIIGAVSLMPAPLEGRANPFLSPEGVKPEWYFMAPFELLHLVPPLVGMLVTGAAVGVLALWPFIDRKPKRITRRPFVMALSFAILGVIVGLTVYSYIHAG